MPPPGEPPSRPRRTGPDRRPPPSPGNEARDAVKAVLDDQAERARRRGGPRPRTPWTRGPAAVLVALLMAGATAWVLARPPAFLQPPPLPVPGSAQVEAGVRVDLYGAALAVERYRDRHGRLPPALQEAVTDPRKAEDLRYTLLPGGIYRLTGRRRDVVVTWESSEPLRRLVEPALPLLDGEADG